jgi:hypothetical protein
MANAPTVPSGTKFEKDGKPVYAWTFTGADGIPTAILGATKSTYTAKTYGDGIYTVTLTYTPAGASEPVLERTSYAVDLVTPPKIAKVGGFGITGWGATDTGVANGVVQGETLTFTVKLDDGDTGPLVYTWLKNGKPFGVTHYSEDLANPHEDSYSLTNIGTDAGKDYGKAPKISVLVETVAKDAKGKPLAKVTSKAITPKLVLPPTVGIKAGKSVFEEAALTVVEGKSLTIATKATGTAKLEYAWYKVGNDGVTLGPKLGAKASLSLKNVTAADAGNYCVVVTNASGWEHRDEAIAVVSVTPKP